MLYRCLILVISICLSATSRAQKLKTEAIFYDGEGTPMCVELKLYDEQSATTFYQIHYDNSSYCITKKENKTDDSSVFEETYFEVFNYDNHPRNLGRVGKILSHQLRVGFDSMKMTEKIKYYYKNDHFIKMEITGYNGKIYNSSEITYVKNKVVRKMYTANNQTMRLKRLDTFSFNQDTTTVRWVINELDWNKTFVSRFIFKDSVALQFNRGDTLEKEIRINRKFDLRQLLSNNIAYEEPIYRCELLRWERAATISINYANGSSLKNEFARDANGNITESDQYRDGKKVLHVVYRYK